MKKIYVRYRNEIEKNNNKQISLIKLACFAGNYITDIFLIPAVRLKELIAQHCCYEKRHDRVNMTDLYQNFKN